MATTSPMDCISRGTSRISRSTTRTVTPGTGHPAMDWRRNLSSFDGYEGTLWREEVSTGAVSVNPYPAMHSAVGNAFSTRSTSSGDAAAPPIITRLMLDVFHLVRSGALIMALAMVGTRHMSVALYF